MLHFIDYRASYLRCFQVNLEGDRPFLRRETVPTPIGSAEKRIFEKTVSDGMLYIEFAERTVEPKIVAIEIQRQDSK